MVYTSTTGGAARARVAAALWKLPLVSAMEADSKDSRNLNFTAKAAVELTHLVEELSKVVILDQAKAAPTPTFVSVSSAVAAV